MESLRRGSAALIAGCVLTIFIFGGCSKGPRRVPAGGVVTLDGKPIEGGILYFNPDVSKGNDARVSCTSPIQSDGHFQLRTDGIERSETGPGVPLGWYKVTIRTNEVGEVPIFPGKPAYKIHARYLDDTKTPLTIEVVENPPPNAYDLSLTSKLPK